MNTLLILPCQAFISPVTSGIPKSLCAMKHAADYIFIEDGFCVDEHSVLFLDALGGCNNGY